METTTTKTVTVNGKQYTVVKAGKFGMDLVGPRGGSAMLVQNIHSGRWVFIVGVREVAIRSIEVA